MKTRHIEIELLEDTVISASSATTGAHRSLDYIPGATLLGASAARLYARLGDQAFDVFHGNRARFSDGLPLVDDRVAWPAPLSWHEAKFLPARSGDCLDGEAVTNRVVDSRPREEQVKQLRDAHVDLATGRWVKPGMRLRMKTALDNGTAAEGQLFGYEALPAGTRFLASVRADDDLLERLLAVLEEGILIGRSRSAEYGRARVRPIETPPPEPAIDPGNFTAVYLAADLCLLDERAQPCLQPDGTMLGLGELPLDPARSFIRTRRYAPWNAHRRAHDMERQVISRGSVLVFKGRPDAAAIERLHADGAGLYRNQGLGRVLVDPWFVAGSIGAFEDAGSADREGPARSEPPPDTPLIRLLRARAGTRDVEIQLVRHAEKLRENLVAQLRQARIASGVLDSQVFGPSKSQWSKLENLPGGYSREALYREIFGDPQQRDRSKQVGLARADNENWSTPIWVGSEHKSISDWFRDVLDGQWPCEPVDGNLDRLRRLVQHLARLMAKEAGQ